MRQEAAITKRDVPFMERPFSAWMGLIGAAAIPIGLFMKPEFRALRPHGPHWHLQLAIVLFAGILVGFVSSQSMLMHIIARIRARQRGVITVLPSAYSVGSMLWLLATLCLLVVGLIGTSVLSHRVVGSYLDGSTMWLYFVAVSCVHCIRRIRCYGQLPD
jgi:hypothetical protein